MHILSYDVASKSLAMSLIKFNENWQFDLSNIKTSFDNSVIDVNQNTTAIELCQTALDHINRLYELLDTLIQPLVLDVVDLIPGKKVNETDVILRANRLNGYLKYVDKTHLNSISKDQPCHVLVEYQMGPNNKSNSVCSQIIYHYANEDNGFNSTLFFKKETNTINNESNELTKTTPNQKVYTIEIVGPSLKNKINLDKEKTRQFYIAKYAKTYDANKKHSTANMKYWLKTKNAEHMIANIKKSNLDDIADSVTMALAWLFIKSGFLFN